MRAVLVGAVSDRDAIFRELDDEIGKAPIRARVPTPRRWHRVVVYGPSSCSIDVGPTGEAEDLFGAGCITPRTGPTIRTLADLNPTTLAVMHGTVFTGDGRQALLDPADDYDRRLNEGLAAVS